MTTTPKSRRANDSSYVSFEDQQRVYQGLTGDKESYVGFDSRFAAWIEKNPREELRP